ncbi:MAG: hypothetical protein KDD62_01110 [Bdellovibrionales bacterium]|nr:hypothetical protein [Bdellovibrionales bacterium]
MGMLALYIKSFSYKQGYPLDSSMHGGGYVFDCRSLPNPGRDPAFRSLTGLDSEVIQYLSKDPLVEEFLSRSIALVEQHVRVFLDRNFDYVSVAFGCTGGQHRSVFCAESLCASVRENFDIQVSVEHIQLKAMGFL